MLLTGFKHKLLQSVQCIKLHHMECGGTSSAIQGQIYVSIKKQNVP